MMISLMGWRHGGPLLPAIIGTMWMERKALPGRVRIQLPSATMERASSEGREAGGNGGDGKSCTGGSWATDVSTMLHGWSVAVVPMAQQSG